MKQLKNIAHGLLTHFISRNNDCDGYWSIGVIVSLGQGQGQGVIDLLHAEGRGLLRHPQLRAMVDHFCLEFLSHLSRHGISPDQILKATVSVDVLPQVRASARHAALVEHAVTCRCEILAVDREPKTASAEVWASPPDPSVDHRSGRVPTGGRPSP